MHSGDLLSLPATFVESVAAISLVCAGIRGLWRRKVKPWLYRELIAPLQQTHQAVTVNGGVSSPPTLKDDLSDVKRTQSVIRDDLASMRGQINDHISWSHEENRRLWTEMSHISK